MEAMDSIGTNGRTSAATMETTAPTPRFVAQTVDPVMRFQSLNRMLRGADFFRKLLAAFFPFRLVAWLVSLELIFL